MKHQPFKTQNYEQSRLLFILGPNLCEDVPKVTITTTKNQQVASMAQNRGICHDQRQPWSFPGITPLSFISVLAYPGWTTQDRSTELPLVQVPFKPLRMAFGKWIRSATGFWGRRGCIGNVKRWNRFLIVFARFKPAGCLLNLPSKTDVSKPYMALRPHFCTLELCNLALLKIDWQNCDFLVN